MEPLVAMLETFLMKIVPRGWLADLMRYARS